MPEVLLTLQSELEKRRKTREGALSARAEGALTIPTLLPDFVPAPASEPQQSASTSVQESAPVRGNEKAEKTRTWGEFIKEADDVFLYRPGRTWGEYLDQTLNWTVSQVHESVKDYEPPEPKKKIPGWWAAMRGPVAKLFEGLSKYNRFKAAGIAFAVSLMMIGLPILGFWNWPFYMPIMVGAALLKLRVQHFDWIISNVIHPISVGVYHSIKFIVDNTTGPFAEKYIDPTLHKWTNAYKDWRGKRSEEQKAQEEKLYNERQHSGEADERAFANAEWELFGMTFLGNWTKLKDLIERYSPQTYKRDILSMFDWDNSHVDLELLKDRLEESPRYKTFVSILNVAGYECRLVKTGTTVIVEIWKKDSGPQSASA